VKDGAVRRKNLIRAEVSRGQPAGTTLQYGSLLAKEGTLAAKSRRGAGFPAWVEREPAIPAKRRLKNLCHNCLMVAAIRDRGLV